MFISPKGVTSVGSVIQVDSKTHAKFLNTEIFGCMHIGSALKEYLQAQPNNMLCEISQGNDKAQRVARLYRDAQLWNKKNSVLLLGCVHVSLHPSKLQYIGAEAINQLWTMYIVFVMCRILLVYMYCIYSLLKVHDRHSTHLELESVLTHNSGEEGVSLCCTYEVYIALYQ